MKNQISLLVANAKENIIKLTQELVKIHSETGQEEAIIQRLEEIMKEYGFEDVVIDDMGNLIGKMGSGEKVLAIDGHVDTVAIGKRKNWNFDPLGGEISKQKLHGRGSCDQKGGLATALYACKLLKEIGLPENLKIYLVASVFEEIFEGLNWQHIIKVRGIKPDAVLLTEPSNLKIIIGHRGRMDLQIEVEGLSSHGADPDLGENAIYKMIPIMKEIDEMHANLPSDQIYGKDTITVTKINSESVSLNAVAHGCIIHIDRRLGRNDTKESVLKELNELPSVKETNAKVSIVTTETKSYKDFQFSIEGYYPSWQMEETHILVEKAKEAYSKQMEQAPELGLWRFSTNGVATKGLFDIPTIGFGPGDERYAHTADEHVPIEHLLKATEFYISFMLKYGEK
ncbi:MAG: YgeY family selenium metabolism-linked hydrolase [Candidatus Heimdallarchaeota archaeon]